MGEAGFRLPAAPTLRLDRCPSSAHNTSRPPHPRGAAQRPPPALAGLGDHLPLAPQGGAASPGPRAFPPGLRPRRLPLSSPAAVTPFIPRPHPPITTLERRGIWRWGGASRARSPLPRPERAAGQGYSRALTGPRPRADPAGGLEMGMGEALSEGEESCAIPIAESWDRRVAAALGRDGKWP